MKNKLFVGTESRKVDGNKWGLFDIRSGKFFPGCYTRNKDTAAEMLDMSHNVLSRPVEQILKLHHTVYSADDEEYIESMFVDQWCSINNDAVSTFLDLLDEKEKRLLAKKVKKQRKSGKRGRPPKNATGTAARGRGRPRKQPESAPVATEEKRGRGRPKKQAETANEEPAVKRSRGRPRKVAV
jgi:hypothetical protein